MAWKIEFTRSAEKELGKLDRQVIHRILKFIKERVEIDPRSVGEQLKGTLAGFWRYRVGDYRLYADIQDEKATVVILKVGHRKTIYRR
jgi:mRNA interferase RelE/StbE